jgi:hypothetical protein
MAEQIGDVDKLKKLREDYKKTFSTEEGKRVLLDLAEKGFFNSTTFDPSKEYATIFNEGMRCFFLYIKNIMELDIEALERLRGR